MPTDITGGVSEIKLIATSAGNYATIKAGGGFKRS